MKNVTIQESLLQQIVRLLDEQNKILKQIAGLEPKDNPNIVQPKTGQKEDKS